MAGVKYDAQEVKVGTVVQNPNWTVYGSNETNDLE